MKSRIAIIVVSATLTVGSLAFATGMKHCHRNANHGHTCAAATGEASNYGTCHSGGTENSSRPIE